MGYRRVCRIARKVIEKDIKVELMPYQQTLERDPPVEEIFGLAENPHSGECCTENAALLYL